MDIKDESRLLEQIRNGDKEAFAKLVEPLIARSYQTALAILRSSHLAEEAVQNALIEAYQLIKAGKEIRHFSGWFRRVIANRSLDLVRKEGRYGVGVDIDTVTLQDSAASPIEEVVRKEESNEVLDAILSLDNEQRAVIVLYYFQDMKIEEIAAALRLSEANVKTRLYRARTRLSKLVSFSDMNGRMTRV